MDKFWLKSYPPGVPHEIDPGQYRSLTHLLEESFRKNATRPFSVCMDRRPFASASSTNSSVTGSIFSLRCKIQARAAA